MFLRYHEWQERRLAERRRRQREAALAILHPWLDPNEPGQDILLIGVYVPTDAIDTGAAGVAGIISQHVAQEARDAILGRIARRQVERAESDELTAEALSARP